MRAVCELSAYARCVLSVRGQRAGLLCVLGGRAARPIDLRPATARRPPPEQRARRTDTQAGHSASARVAVLSGEAHVPG